MPTPERAAHRCFLSYRREDAAGHAGRLADHLLERFGPVSVFMDVDSIGAGVDFLSEIERAISEADVVLVVIGPGWLEAKDATGSRRLDDPADLVRREVEVALASGIRVIPVLVGGASMPGEGELPEPISGLARRNAVELQDRRWRQDVEALAELLGRRVAPCPSCGRENPEDARFCAGCRAPLQGTREVRKTVTALAVELTLEEGSPDPEVRRASTRRVLADAEAVLARYEAGIERPVGGSLLAIFGVPQAREDDARRAVRAAAELRGALAEHASFSVRIGVATGEVLAGSDGVPEGEPLQVALSLARSAPPGDVHLSRSAHRLVRREVHVEEASGGALRLLGLTSEEPHLPTAPLVGRDRELSLLRDALERTIEGGSPTLFTVLGVPGVGKSRLASEFVASLGDRARPLRGRCLSYGEGITFWPVAEIVRQAAGIAQDDRPEESLRKIAAVLEEQERGERAAQGVADALGFSDTGFPPEEILWAIRRFFEAAAQDRPLVLVLDDLHWAEDRLLDLVDHVAELAQAPILLLCLARPELLDDRPGWGAGKTSATALQLEPLSEEAGRTLLRQRLEGADIEQEVGRLLLERAGGNPLFLEETLSLMLEEGWLRKEGERWEASDRSDLPLPASVQAVLGARLERLAPSERSVLEAASVEGEGFTLDAVVELCGEGVRGGVENALIRLARKRFIRRERPGAYAFRHILIRDSAYATIPKGRRVTLHEGFARYLERSAGPRLPELQGFVGYHLEQAYRYAVELDPEADVTALARQAAGHLAEAGRHALDVGAIRSAVDLLSRSTGLPSSDPVARFHALLDLSDACFYAASYDRALSLASETIVLADSIGDERLRAHAEVNRLHFESRIPGRGTLAEIPAEAERLRRILEEHGDELGLARVWSLVFAWEWARCQYDASRDAAERSAEHARRAGASGEEAGALSGVVGAILYGSTPVDEGILLVESILEGARSERSSYGLALVDLGGLYAMRGDFDRARAACSEGRAILEEIGATQLAAGSSQVSGGIVAMLEMYPAHAERELRTDLDFFEGIGENWDVPTHASLLARAILAQGGRDAEAEELVHRSREVAQPDDISSQIAWRSLAGLLAARRGELEDGARLVREAISLSRRTDGLSLQWEALEDFGAVLTLAGDLENARQAEMEALQLHEAKGNVVGAARLRAELADPSSPPTR